LKSGYSVQVEQQYKDPFGIKQQSLTLLFIDVFLEKF